MYTSTTYNPILIQIDCMYCPCSEIQALYHKINHDMPLVSSHCFSSHDLLVLRVSRNALLESSLHGFRRHTSEADWSTLPHMILLDVFEYGCDTSLPPVVANYIQTSCPLKNDSVALQEHWSADTENSLCTLRRSSFSLMQQHGLCFLRWFLAGIFSVTSNSSSQTLPLD